jgi:hypothetical protein
MSRLARSLMLVAMLAAMNLAAMTAVAQAHPATAPADQSSVQAEATVQRLLAREEPTIPKAAPAQATSPVRPAPPSGQADWRIPALGALAAVLALVAAVAVLTARRATRIRQAGQTA